MPQVTRQFVLAASLLVSAIGFASAQSSAALTGVVRDAHGTPQMGVLVELIGTGTFASALTDLGGRYQVAHLLPGLYQVRATAALAAPLVRRNIRIAAGAGAVVNLMMTGSFDQTAWETPGTRRNGEIVEDWKWTLRSPANRPMLRLVDDGAGWPSGETLGENKPHSETHSILRLQSRQGSFGASGEGLQLIVDQRSHHGARETSFAAGTTRSAGSVGVPLAFSAAMETGMGVPSGHLIAARLRSYPQLRTAEGAVPMEVALTSAERMQLGDVISLVVGSETQYLRAGSSLLVTRPFLRVRSQPLAGWSLSYAFATSPQRTGFGEAESNAPDVPTMVTAGGRLRTDSALHHEIRVRKNLGQVGLEVAVHHTNVARAAVSGALLDRRSALWQQPLAAAVEPEGVTVDRSNGLFRTLVGGYMDDGYSVLLHVPAGERLSLTGAYLSSVGLVAQDLDYRASSRPATQRAQAFFLAAEGRLPRTGTHISSSYRWQPARIISVLSPFELQDDAPYLGVHVRQPIRSSSRYGEMQITLDGTNLLAEGYRQSSIAAQDALLASALRELRLGLAFSF